MTKVTIGNFHNLYPTIKEKIKNNTFLSIDCEFSGWDTSKPLSLFDSTSTRYLNEKCNIEGFLIVQFGLSIFNFDINENKFNVSSYSFPLLPPSSSRAAFRSSSIAFHFLSSVGFDWNSLFNESLCYVSRHDRKKFLTSIENGELIEDINIEFERYFESMLEMVKKMVLEDGKETFFTNKMFNDPRKVYQCLKLIRKEFHNVWIERISSTKIRIFRVPTKMIAEFNEKEKAENILNDYFMGFSHVIEDICAQSQPIVGHNLMKDLLMIYQQFIGPLPSTYKEYKNEINKLFPNIYDTKLLGYRLRKEMPLNIKCDFKNLDDLFNFLDSKNIQMVRPYGPTFSNPPNATFHDAGFDSYCTGYCFAVIAYFFSILVDREFKFPKSIRTWSSLLNALKEYKNCINIMRAQAPYIKFDGNDPDADKHILYIRSKTQLDYQQISMICRVHSSVDLKNLSAYEALVSITNDRAANLIAADLKKNNFYVSYGVPWSHKYPLKKITAVSLVVILLFAMFRQASKK